MTRPPDISAVVPGGILETDHVHVGTYDETCSRCRREIPELEVPLLLWLRGANDVLAYCRRCTGQPDDREDARALLEQLERGDPGEAPH